MLPPIRVMTIDDSAVVRGTIVRVVNAEPDMEIVASAPNARLALLELERGIRPEVILLDVEMPGQSGLELLPQLRTLLPQSKILMVSSLTASGAETCMKAFAIGAVDCLGKPSTQGGSEAIAQFKRELREKIRAVCHRIPPLPAPSAVAASPLPAAFVSAVRVPLSTPSVLYPVRAVAIASSTGGPQALLAFFKTLGDQCRDISFWIAQHMPPTFTTLLAERIRDSSGMECHEAIDGEAVKPGVAYMAPGDFHLHAAEERGQVVCRLSKDAPVNYCRPSADPMFQSLAHVYGHHLLAMVLTGMGQDGLEGARAVVQAGGQVIVQDEASSVIWGMPRAVAEAGLAHSVLPLQELPAYVTRRVRGTLS